MAGQSELLWRLLPAVRPLERSRALFFTALLTLISLGQTLGLAGSEALLVSELGAESVPLALIGASLLTVGGSIVYAARVGVERNDGLFLRMLASAAVVLGAGTLVAEAGAIWILPVLFAFFYLAQAIFLNHFWTFSGDYFDAVTCKRLFPVFTVGSSVGGALGGAAAAGVTSVVGPVSLIGAWAVTLALAALLLRLWQRPLRVWGPLGSEEADETSVESMQGALRYLRGSRFGLWLVLSALGMIVALNVGVYLYLDIFSREFPEAEDLAVFLGIFLAATNVIEIVLEIALTPWLIRRLGVPSAHLVHPVLTLASFGGLASSYGLASGVAARANRELIENAVAGPVRTLLYNGIPLRFRGRMRAFLEGIVVYGGMSLAGLLLIVAETPDPRWLCLIGASASVVYLVANLRARREYLRELVEQIRAGRLDLAEVGEEIGNWEATRLATLWEQLVVDESDRPSRPLLQLVPTLAQRGLFEPLIRASGHAHPAVRRSCVTALAGSAEPAAEAALARALADEDAGVRLAALRGLSRRGVTPGHEPAFRALLADPDPAVRAESALHAGAEGRDLLASMLRGTDPSAAGAALHVAPVELESDVLDRLHDPEPALRAATLEWIARNAAETPLGKDDLLEALRDRDARVRHGAVLALANWSSSDALSALAGALGDPATKVQFAAETVLRGLGDEGVEAVLPELRSQRERAVMGALRVVAGSGAPRSRAVLTGEMRHRVRDLWRAVLAYQQLPPEGDVAERFLRVAYEDEMLRGGRLAFRTLRLLENERVMDRVEKALRFGSPRSRGDALEVLSNLGDRESAALLVLLHENAPLEDRIGTVRRFLAAPRSLEDVRESSRRAESRWIRLAAEAMLSGASTAEEEFMERLLALRQVPLFSNLSLEQLEAVQRLTEEEEYLAGEAIMREGDPGGTLCLLLEGRVHFFKNHGEPGETLLSTYAPITYFGEMAILDDEPRSVTAVAAESVRILSLEGESLKELVLQMPEISFEIFRVLTRRVRAAEARLGGS